MTIKYPLKAPNFLLYNYYMTPDSQIAPVASPPNLTRAQIIARVGRYLPHTQEGLPAGFYRADLIPSELPASHANLPAVTDAAFTPLNHQEGFPALPDGRPFWHKLDYESPAAFAAFESYVNLGNDGPRYIAALLQSPELQRLFGTQLDLDYLQELHALYYWKDRAHAYDLFREAAYRHIRMRRAQSMENYHYEQSSTLLKRVFEALSTDETFEAMKHDPKLLLDAMEKLIKVQRVSVGMPANAPAESMKGAESNPTTFEMLLRQVTQKDTSTGTNSKSTTLDEQGRVIPTTDNLLRGALNDPKTANMLQEVIIRVSTSQGATKKPRWADTYSRDGEEGSDPDPDSDPDPSEGS